MEFLMLYHERFFSRTKCAVTVRCDPTDYIEKKGQVEPNNNPHQRTSTIRDMKIFIVKIMIFVPSITGGEECDKTDTSVIEVVRFSQSIWLVWKNQYSAWW